MIPVNQTENKNRSLINAYQFLVIAKIIVINQKSRPDSAFLILSFQPII